MSNVYRTRTYIATDFDHDKDAVEQLHKWNDSNHWSLSFVDAHDLQTSNDSSLYCSIKSSLKMRMDHSKTFVLIIGDHTKDITKVGCQYCDSYNSHNLWCARGYSMNAIIPLPPIEEQHRIVSRLDEILPKIGELEAIENEL